MKRTKRLLLVEWECDQCHLKVSLPKGEEPERWLSLPCPPVWQPGAASYYSQKQPVIFHHEECFNQWQVALIDTVVRLPTPKPVPKVRATKATKR